MSVYARCYACESPHFGPVRFCPFCGADMQARPQTESKASPQPVRQSPKSEPIWVELDAPPSTPAPSPQPTGRRRQTPRPEDVPRPKSGKESKKKRGVRWRLLGVVFLAIGLWFVLGPQISSWIEDLSGAPEPATSAPPAGPGARTDREPSARSTRPRPRSPDAAPPWTRYPSPRTLYATTESRVRNRPSTRGTKIVSGLTVGQEVTVLGENADGTWLVVPLAGDEVGFVAARLLSAEAPSVATPRTFQGRSLPGGWQSQLFDHNTSYSCAVIKSFDRQGSFINVFSMHQKNGDFVEFRVGFTDETGGLARVANRARGMQIDLDRRPGLPGISYAGPRIGTAFGYVLVASRDHIRELITSDDLRFTALDARDRALWRSERISLNGASGILSELARCAASIN